MTEPAVQPAPVIDTTRCTSCDTDWLGVAPMFPEAYICAICQQWLDLFKVPKYTPGTLPIYGPIKSIRRLLARQTVTHAEICADQSAWIIISPKSEISEWVSAQMARMIEESAETR